MSHHRPADFEALFAADDDPWHFRSRWYEARKRALTLACLPAPRYASGYEPGCANGELSAALAGRCDRLIVSDGAEGAVEVARRRNAALPHVEVRRAWVPDEWPDESFDLIVISELGYYLDAGALDQLAAKTLESLAGGGTVLGCHWRWPIEGCRSVGDEVQRRLGQALGLPRLLEVVDADLRLEVWCRDAASVAQREGLAQGPLLPLIARSAAQSSPLPTLPPHPALDSPMTSSPEPSETAAPQAHAGETTTPEPADRQTLNPDATASESPEVSATSQPIDPPVGASGTEGAMDAAPAAETEARPEPAANPGPATSPPTAPADCSALLKKTFPALFSGAPKPLKLRIQIDIQERAPGVFGKQALSAFFRRYTGSTSYLIAVSRSKHRFDLDGAPAGDLTEEHRKIALDELARRRGNQESRVALEDRQRRNRATLLHDFDRTTLTPANFCALKGIAVDELDGYLATARREAAERPPMSPAFEPSRRPPPRHRERQGPGAQPDVRAPQRRR